MKPVESNDRQESTTMYETRTDIETVQSVRTVKVKEVLHDKTRSDNPNQDERKSLHTKEEKCEIAEERRMKWPCNQLTTDDTLADM